MPRPGRCQRPTDLGILLPDSKPPQPLQPSRGVGRVGKMSQFSPQDQCHPLICWVAEVGYPGSRQGDWGRRCAGPKTAPARRAAPRHKLCCMLGSGTSLSQPHPVIYYVHLLPLAAPEFTVTTLPATPSSCHTPFPASCWPSGSAAPPGALVLHSHDRDKICDPSTQKVAEAGES